MFEEVNRRTAQGGSQFEAPDVDSPLGVASAAITVIARPFPWEATNLQTVLVGMESLALVGLLLASAKRLARLPLVMLRDPFVAFAAVYAIGFVVTFVNVENFGILARQRVQVLPLVFVLLCIPIPDRRDVQAVPRPARARELTTPATG